MFRTWPWWSNRSRTAYAITVIRARKRYAESGLEETPHRRNQANRHRNVDELVEAHLIAKAMAMCNTLELLPCSISGEFLMWEV